MRKLLLLSLISLGFLATPGLPEIGSAQAQDWNVRRDPFDKGLIARYKRILEKKPSDAGALSKLMGMYRRYRSVGLLIREYENDQSKKQSFSNLMVLGYLQQHEGQDEIALAYFQQAAAKRPDDSAVHSVLGTMLRKAGKRSEAREHFSKALEHADRKDAKMESLRALADLAMGDGDIDGAKKFYERYIDLDPKNLQTRLELGDALAQHKRYDEAIKIFRAAEQKLRSDPAARIEVITRIGSALQGKGEDMAAVAEYERGIKLVGRGYFAVKELTARIIEIYRQRQELADLSKKLESSWNPSRRGHFEWDTLARLYEETGLADKAIDAYRKATKKAPYELDTQRRLIVLLENSGRQQEALKQYEAVIRVAPGEPRFQLELARRYWKLGDTKKAIAMAKKIESRFSGDAGVVSALADLYTVWNKPDQALAAFQTLARIEPDDPRHLENLGEQYFQRGDKRKAQQVWKKIIRVKNAENYARLASVYSEHDMLTEGLAMYGQAIRLETKQAALYKGRANVYERMRSWKEAIADWEAVLRLSPDKKSFALARREARRRVVNLLIRSNPRDKAALNKRINEWKLGFAAEPADLNAGYYLVEAYGRLGSAPQQQSALERLLEKRPKDQSVMEQLVKVYREVREFDSAIELLLKLASLNPGRERDYFNQIAEIKTDLQQDGEAIEYVRRALEKSPNDPIAYQRLAERYQAMQKHAEAIAAYEKVIELSPRSFRVYFTLARLYINQSELDKASELYRSILSKASDNEILDKAGREAVELEWLNGSLAELERTVAPLVASYGHKPIYRRILVQLYDRYVPDLASKLTSSSPKVRKAARAELGRLGTHGLRPLLEALADEKDVQQQQIAVSVLGYLGNHGAAAPLVRMARTETESPSHTRIGTMIPSIDWGVRFEALVAAGRLGDPRIIPDLVALSKHKELQMREAAIFALGMTKDRKALPALFEAAADKRDSVRTLSCLALANIADKKISAHASAIVADESMSDLTRASCAWLLGYRKDSKAGAVLVDALAQGNDSTQRLAAWALGQLGDRSALPALIAAYYSKLEPVRGEAARAVFSLLSRKVSPSAPIQGFPMSGQRFDERRAVQELAGQANSREFDAALLIGHEKQLAFGIRSAISRHRDLVLRALSDLDARPESLALGALTVNLDALAPAARRSLESTLRAVGTELLPELEELSQHRDPEVRRRSINILAKLGGSQAATLISAALSDGNLGVRKSAMRSAALLARLHRGQGDALAATLATRLQAEQWQERVVAAEALGTWPGNAKLDVLVRALRTDAKGFVRSAAARALGAKGSRSAEVLKALGSACDAQQEPLEPVRIAAVRALQALGGDEAAKLVERTAGNDPSPRVRRAAGKNDR